MSWSSAKQGFIFTLFDTRKRRRIQASCPASHVRHSSVGCCSPAATCYRAALAGGHFPLYPRAQACGAAIIYSCRKLGRNALPAAILLFFGALLGAFAAAQERSDNTLRKFNDSVDALIKKVSPSVVQILVTGYGPVESAERGNTAVVIGRQRAIGSGFVIDPAGYIITNAHVVAGAQRVQVVVPE